jgi:hypothetical protein
MINITKFEVLPYTYPGNNGFSSKVNNGTDWLRRAINDLYNRGKGNLKSKFEITDYFHNHNETNSSTITRYPLILFQQYENRFFVSGINEGGDLLNELFAESKSYYTIDNDLLVRVLKVENSFVDIHVNSKSYIYKLKSWLPLSVTNYKKYIMLDSLSEKILFLESLLKGHIVKDFLHHLNINIPEQEIKVSITDIDSFSNCTVPVKQDKHIKDFQPFNITFRTNILLPEHICLGNAKVYGFGLLSYVQ